MSFVINPYTFESFWSKLSSTAGKVITGFSSTFTNAMTVNWGDGSTTPLTSGVSVNKTLGTTNAIELETNNAVVTTINCGTSSPRLGGTVDISAFPELQEFRCNSNDITALSGYANNSNLRIVHFSTNKVTGSLPSLSGMTNLQQLWCNANELTGSIPSLAGLSQLRSLLLFNNYLAGNIPAVSGSPLLRDLYVNNQLGATKLTGPIPDLSLNTALLVVHLAQNQLTGSIPALTQLTQLQRFQCQSNQLTGSIPSLAGLTQLQDFFCESNQLTGSIPSLAGLGSLQRFTCQLNQLTGQIPSLGGLNGLTLFRCFSNQLTGFAGGSVSNTLGEFQAQNNQLTSTAVNAILSAFVAAGRTSANGTCLLYLHGTGNAAPTGQGLTDKAALQSRGWTVLTN